MSYRTKKLYDQAYPSESAYLEEGMEELQLQLVTSSSQDASYLDDAHQLGLIMSFDLQDVDDEFALEDALRVTEEELWKRRRLH